MDTTISFKTSSSFCFSFNFLFISYIFPYFTYFNFYSKFFDLLNVSFNYLSMSTMYPFFYASSTSLFWRIFSYCSSFEFYSSMYFSSSSLNSIILVKSSLIYLIYSFQSSSLSPYSLRFTFAFWISLIIWSFSSSRFSSYCSSSLYRASLVMSVMNSPLVKFWDCSKFSPWSLFKDSLSSCSSYDTC